ncbi:ABC transporter permease [Myroides injenensis]|uniref:ABC transporter permease n=1 Tax=Myroides injenensis TaxID=1183151 RepID=UPI00028A14B4|nr:ABC transporter permease [Myroides injenensis]
MVLYFRLLVNSFQFAINSLKTNRLRTILSLLGVTIGVFSIIAVLAAVDSLDKNIKKELSGFDLNMIYVFNHSFGPVDIPRWKVDQYPKMTFDEYEYLKRNVNGVEYISYNFFTKAENIKYNANYASDVIMKPTGVDMQYLDNVKIANGRFFNEAEANNGSNVIVLGYEVAKTLFDDIDPIGKIVRLYGRNFRVVGVIEKQGASSITFDSSYDERAYFPSNCVRQIYGENNSMLTPVVVLKPFEQYDVNEFEDEIRAKLRLFRGMKIGEDDNFFVNVFGGMLDFIDGIIEKMNVVGWIVSGFSLLVGGFGIANIMFVSVKERTHLIGIQKSIGAKKKFILLQFLFESIILALIGGVVGIILVWMISFFVSTFTSFFFVLSFSNILKGLVLSGIIGMISGFLPARSAANLDPVEAIRMGM